MKSPKKPSKEPSLPSQDESRRANVLREEMLSQFRMLGEALSAVREDVSSMKPDLHAVKEDVAILKVAARSHTETLLGHTDAIRANTEAVQTVQVDLKNYSQRLDAVESKLAS